MLPGAGTKRMRQLACSHGTSRCERKGRVYFIPGNHTWNKPGIRAIEKIKRQEQFIAGLGDSLTKFFAGPSCPDPVAINIRDSSMIIFFNSEWWLFPVNNTQPGNECECKTRSEGAGPAR